MTIQPNLFDRIEAILARGPATFNAIYAECTVGTTMEGCSASAFRAFIDALIHEGRVVRNGQFGYAKAVRS